MSPASRSSTNSSSLVETGSPTSSRHARSMRSASSARAGPRSSNSGSSTSRWALGPASTRTSASRRSLGLAGLLLLAIARRLAPGPLLEEGPEEVDDLRACPPRLQLLLQASQPQGEDLGRGRPRLGLMEQDLQVDHVRMERLPGGGQPPQSVVQPAQAIAGIGGPGGLPAQALVGLAELRALPAQLAELHLRDELRRGMAHRSPSSPRTPGARRRHEASASDPAANLRHAARDATRRGRARRGDGRTGRSRGPCKSRSC